MADATAELERASADIPLNKDARDVLERATALAADRGAAQAAPTDVLEAITADRGSSAYQAIKTLAGDPKAIDPHAAGVDGAPGLPLRQLLVNANREAQVLGHYQVDSMHLLLALMYSDARATSVALQKVGLTLYDLRRHLQTGAGPNIPVAAGVHSTQDRALRRKPLVSLRGALGISPFFGGLVAVTAVSGIFLWFDILPAASRIVTVIFVTAGWITSVCVHEFGHALVAYLGGDSSVHSSGYLELNPLRYTHVMLSLVMPVLFLLLGGIGLPGGAVYINRSALRSRGWDSAVSVAGPVGTLVSGVLVAVPFALVGADTWIAHPTFFGALAFLGFIEAIALVLNLLPIPGLDGFGIIRPWLPYSVQGLANQYGQLGILIVFGLIFFVSPVSQAFFGLALYLTDVAGIPRLLIGYGAALMPRLH